MITNVKQQVDIKCKISLRKTHEIAPKGYNS